MVLLDPIPSATSESVICSDIDDNTTFKYALQAIYDTTQVIGVYGLESEESAEAESALFSACSYLLSSDIQHDSG